VHARRKPERICIEHRVIRVKELVVHAVEDVTTVVGCQRSWALEGRVLWGRHWGRHVVRGREVLLREGPGARRVVARVVVVVGVGLFLILLLCNTKSA
jgi:hypothetical protein